MMIGYIARKKLRAIFYFITNYIASTNPV